MKQQRWTITLLLAAACWHAAGQTTVDLSRQGKLGTGTTLPAHCAVGQVFFKTDAPTGSNLYACATPDVWAVMGLPVMAGDAGGTQTSVTVKGIQGRKVSAATPADQNILRWNAVVGQWEPGVVPATGTALPPGTCAPGSLYLLSDPASNIQQLYVCSNTNTWTMSSSRSGLAANRPSACIAGQTWLSTDTGAMTYCAATGNPGTWSATNIGPPGANGNTILSGASAPSSGIGANGDFFLHMTANCLYGPKASGAWPGNCTSLTGSSNYSGISGNAAMTTSYKPTGLIQTAIEPACNLPSGGLMQAAFCEEGHIGGLFNPGPYSNQAIRMIQGYSYNGRNNQNNKRTFLGLSNNVFSAGAGQRMGFNNYMNCYGVGDCFGISTQVESGGFGTAGGDEDAAGSSNRVYQPGWVRRMTVGYQVKSACAITSFAANVAASTGPTDIKTVQVNGSTANCSPGDWFNVGIGPPFEWVNTEQEAVQITGKTGNSISALFQSAHNSGEPIAPAPVLSDSNSANEVSWRGWGQGRIIVSLNGASYSTGTATFAYGSGTVLGAGGATWSEGMVGGDAGLIGCMAAVADLVNVGTFSGDPVHSWFPIASLQNSGQITLARAYTGVATSGAAYIIRPCARIVALQMAYGPSADTTTGIVLESSHFDWTPGTRIEQTLSPYAGPNKLVSADFLWHGPLAYRPDMFRAINTGYQAAGTGLRITDTILSEYMGKAGYLYPITIDANYQHVGLSISGKSLEYSTGGGALGSAIAMTTYAADNDPKRVSWGAHDGNGSADIYPDTATGEFIIDARKAQKLTLMGSALNGTRKFTLDASGITDTRTVKVPDGNGMMAVISGTPANGDCMKYQNPGYGPFIVSAGAPCGPGPSGSANQFQLNNGAGAFSGSHVYSDSLGTINIMQSGAPGSVAIRIGTYAGENNGYDYTLNREGGRYLTFNGTQNADSGYEFQTNNGQTKLVIQNNGLVSLGGATATHPALKPSSTTLAVRLADDSGDAPITASTLGAGGGACKIRSGSGSPEAVVAGNVCDLYLRTDGGPGTTMYVKESGTGNTGWAGK